jgi:hypothetical protein
MARVIGPTPPGIGATNDATSITPGSTSPSSPFGVREIPTSITTAPL